MALAISATAETDYEPAIRPTLYFVGTSTGRSAIMHVLPRWAEYLGLGDVAIQGIDCRWHDDPAVYRRIVEFIKHDSLSRGALVTTHKVDLLKACRDLFDYLDPHALLTEEISCISKRNGTLRGHAKDITTSGLSLEAIVPAGHWSATGAEVFCMGAGGSAVALTSYLVDPSRGLNRPTRLILSNRSAPRLAEAREVHARLPASLPIEYHHTPHPENNDALLQRVKPHSLVINATGLGKEAPGSPLTGAAHFPDHGFAWDFNYRGDLVFLDQARAQAAERHLTIADGWTYFVHGWTRAVAEIFDVEIPTQGRRFDELSAIAANARP